MATVRKIVFANEEIYHTFNRGLDRRPTFIDKRELTRALELIRFYQYSNTPIRYSQFLLLPKDKQEFIYSLMTSSPKLVSIISFCLMPNHFHFLLKQLEENGVSRFISDFTNSYTKYFNLKNSRTGPLFGGTFKAVCVESNEQLLHLSRYIHINPVVSSVITLNDLSNYRWSSYPEFTNPNNNGLCNKELVLNMFKHPEIYQRFVLDQIDYAKELETIKHLTLE